MDSFYAIDGVSKGLFKDRGSKFLSFAFPVKSEEDVKSRLQELRSEYFDARHHCYAYILGMRNQRFRANDDGEPNHSAGDPILGQIRSFGLTNTLVVVVRYFGGTKLGVSGLINAYKTAAEFALKEATRIRIYPMVKIEVNYSYQETPQFERLFAPYDITFLAREFAETCKAVVELKEQDYLLINDANKPPNQISLRLVNDRKE